MCYDIHPPPIQRWLQTKVEQNKCWTANMKEGSIPIHSIVSTSIFLEHNNFQEGPGRTKKENTWKCIQHQNQLWQEGNMRFCNWFQSGLQPSTIERRIWKSTMNTNILVYSLISILSVVRYQDDSGLPTQTFVLLSRKIKIKFHNTCVSGS